jgi:hypothetical protein
MKVPCLLWSERCCFEDFLSSLAASNKALPTPQLLVVFTWRGTHSLHVSQCVLLCIYPLWGWFTFLNLYIYVFFQFEKFTSCFFTFFSHSTLLFSVFFSPLFTLGSFYFLFPNSMVLDSVLFTLLVGYYSFKFWNLHLVLFILSHLFAKVNSSLLRLFFLSCLYLAYNCSAKHFLKVLADLKYFCDNTNVFVTSVLSSIFLILFEILQVFGLSDFLL